MFMGIVHYMRANNPAAFQRFDQAVEQFESAVDPEVGATMREWLTSLPSAGARRPPISAVAPVLLPEREITEALEPFQIVRQSVPEYTTLPLEYGCLVLNAKQSSRAT
jgi:hypothetical protein